MENQPFRPSVKIPRTPLGRVTADRDNVSTPGQTPKSKKKAPRSSKKVELIPYADAPLPEPTVVETIKEAPPCSPPQSHSVDITPSPAPLKQFPRMTEPLSGDNSGPEHTDHATGLTPLFAGLSINSIIAPRSLLRSEALTQRMLSPAGRMLSPLVPAVARLGGSTPRKEEPQQQPSPASVRTSRMEAATASPLNTAAAELRGILPPSPLRMSHSMAAPNNGARNRWTAGLVAAVLCGLAASYSLGQTSTPHLAAAPAIETEVAPTNATAAAIAAAAAVAAEPPPAAAAAPEAAPATYGTFALVALCGGSTRCASDLSSAAAATPLLASRMLCGGSLRCAAALSGADTAATDDAAAAPTSAAVTPSVQATSAIPSFLTESQLPTTCPVPLNHTASPTPVAKQPEQQRKPLMALPLELGLDTTAPAASPAAVPAVRATAAPAELELVLATPQLWPTMPLELSLFDDELTPVATLAAPLELSVPLPSSFLLALAAADAEADTGDPAAYAARLTPRMVPAHAPQPGALPPTCRAYNVSTASMMMREARATQQSAAAKPLQPNKASQAGWLSFLGLSSFFDASPSPSPSEAEMDAAPAAIEVGLDVEAEADVDAAPIEVDLPQKEEQQQEVEAAPVSFLIETELAAATVAAAAVTVNVLIAAALHIETQLSLNLVATRPAAAPIEVKTLAIIRRAAAAPKAAPLANANKSLMVYDAEAYRAAPVEPSMPAAWSRLTLWAASSSSSSPSVLDSGGQCDAGHLAASKELVVYQHSPMPAAATIADATVHLTLPASLNVVATHPLASPLSRHTARGPAKMEVLAPPPPATRAAAVEPLLLLAPPPAVAAVDPPYVAARTPIVIAQPTCQAPPRNRSASAATGAAAAATAADAAATPTDGTQPQPQPRSAAAVPFVARALCGGQPRCTAAAVRLLGSMSPLADTSTLITRALCAGEPKCTAAATTFVASLALPGGGITLAARMMCAGQRRCTAAAASMLCAASQSPRPNATSLAASVLCASQPRCSAAAAATLSSLATQFDAAGWAAAAVCAGERRCIDAVGSATASGVLRSASTMASAVLGGAYRIFGEAALRPRAVRNGAFDGASDAATAPLEEARAYFGPARYIAPPSCAAPAPPDANDAHSLLFATGEDAAGTCPAPAATAPRPRRASLLFAPSEARTEDATEAQSRRLSPLVLWLLLCASAGVGLLLLAAEEATPATTPATAPRADDDTTTPTEAAAEEEATPPPPPFAPPASPMDACVTPLLQASFGLDDDASDVDYEEDDEADDLDDLDLDDGAIEPRESVRALSMGARALATSLDEAAEPRASLKALQAKTPTRSTPRRSKRVQEAEKRSSRRGFLLPPTPPMR